MPGSPSKKTNIAPSSDSKGDRTSPRKKQKTTEGAEDMKVALYSYWRSSCSWRVRTALAYKGIKYDYIPVHLVKAGGEHLQEEFTKLNPNQRLPSLKIDGHVLSQSGAILEYLEETRPEKALLPTDAFQRAQVRNLCGIIGCDIQPVQNLAILKLISEDVSAAEKGKKKVAWAKQIITRGFTALEKELSLTAGKYCVGDAISLADVYLEPQVYNATRFGVEMEKFPIISRISKTLADVPAFAVSHPSKQPDAEES